MARYGAHFEYGQQTKNAFTEEELLTAARVFWYAHVPEDLVIPPQELDLRQSEDVLRDRYIIRVVEEVTA